MTGGPSRRITGLSSTGDQEDELARALESYLTDVESGRTVDPEELFAAHPSIAGQLRACIESLRVVEDVARSLESADAAVPSPAGETPDRVLGDFRIRGEIGRGGMGVVYDAVQISLGRRVALKVLPFAAVLDPKQIQRFKNEAQAAAQLHHENIVPIYGIGCDRSVHFYAMQYVEGQTLGHLVKDLRWSSGRDETPDVPTGSVLRPSTAESTGDGDPLPAAGRDGPDGPGPLVAMPSPTPDSARSPIGDISSKGFLHTSRFFRSVAELGAQVGAALSYAHGMGVLHRDIKPSNLLLDGEGKVWVTDFGLARCRSEPGLTVTGDVVGTIQYMSPEQALGKSAGLDERTDIYGLGATLYEILTLEPVYRGRDREELLRKIALQDPPPPRRWNSAIPQDLETIVLKAMAKSPDERYDDALALTSDLRNFLEDRPILARRPSPLARLAKWSRRHRSIVASAAVLLILSTLALAVSTFLIARERDEAKQRGDEAVRERDAAHRNLYLSHLRLAHQEWRTGDTENLSRLLDQYRPAPGAPDLRGWEWYYLKSLHDQQLTVLDHPSDRVTAVAWSPDGRYLASAADGGGVRIWDADTGETLRMDDDGASIRSIHWSVTGRLASAGPGPVLRVRDGESGRDRVELGGFRSEARRVRWSPDGRLLAGSGDTAESGRSLVKIWDATGAARHDVIVDESRVEALEWSPDGALLAVAAFYSNATILVEVATGAVVETIPSGHSAVRSLAWSPDGATLVASSHHRMTFYDAETFEAQRSVFGHPGPVLSLSWNQDGSLLASASEDGRIRVWEEAGVLRLVFSGHRGRVPHVAWSPYGLRLASAGGEDATARIWVARRDPEAFSLDYASAASWSPTGAYFAGVRDEGLVTVVDPATGGRIRDVGQIPKTSCVAWSPDGLYLAASSQTGRVAVWESSGGRTVFDDETAHLGATRAVAWSPDARRLATVGTDRAARIWDLETRAELRVLRGHAESVGSVAWSPDGRRVATASWDQVVKVWDIESGAEVLHLRRHPFRAWAADAPSTIAWSPSGDRLAAGTARGDIVLWDASSGETLERAHGHTANVRSVSWNPDGRRLLSGSEDQTVRVWDAATGVELLTLRSHKGTVWNVSWSPDGKRLITGGSDGLKLWDASRAYGAAPSRRPAGPGKSTSEDSAPSREHGLAHAYDRFLTELNRLRGSGPGNPTDVLRNVRDLIARFDREATSADFDWRPVLAHDFLESFATRAVDPDGVDALVEEAASTLEAVELEPDPHGANTVAWSLVATGSPGPRDVARALFFGRVAVRYAADNGHFWNTVGAARYRAGFYRSALEALTTSEEFRDGGDAWDWLFVAMTRWRLGEKEDARASYERAVRWIESRDLDNLELRAVREEAARLLRVE